MVRHCFYARRKRLLRAGKIRAVRKSQGKERRWMRDLNHKLSRQIVSHAQMQVVGTIRLEELAGIPQRTARTSRGAGKAVATARRNSRMIATRPFSQLSTFMTYTAEQLGVRVVPVDPAFTSQTCPACFARNKAQDRRYGCAVCGWTGTGMRSGQSIAVAGLALLVIGRVPPERTALIGGWAA
jgi:IS605 OrfB family transposase